MSDVKRVIALGFFDGIHLGHARLLQKTADKAAEMRLCPSVLTFDRSPESLVSGKDPGLIFSRRDRSLILREMFGIEDSVDLTFDEKLMRLPWQAFIELLISEYNAAFFVAGYDFHFGYRGEGDAGRLCALCRERGVGCEIVEEVRLDGMTVSSTAVRGMLAEGDIIRANRFLGHRYFLTGTVRKGQQLGRTINMPTINMRYDCGVLVPRRGVYITRSVCADTGESWPSVTNIGVRPTVSGSGAVSVETHLLGASGDLYGRTFRVEFYGFLRPEMKFASVDELKANMERDAAEAERFFQARHE